MIDSIVTSPRLSATAVRKEKCEVEIFERNVFRDIKTEGL